MNTGKYLAARLAARVLGLLISRDEPSRGTRVLMYHDVITGTEQSDIYSLPVAKFAEGISSLARWAFDHDHPFVPLSPVPQPGIAITFDDGYSSTLALAAPILSEHAIPFHVFATKSFVESGDRRYLTPIELQRLADLPGASLGIHGETHTRFTELDEDTLRRELSTTRDWLEQLIQRPVSSLSYPHGSFTPRTRRTVEASGFTIAACSKIGTFTSPEQTWRVPRIDIWSYDDRTSTIGKTRGDWDSLLP